MQSERKSPEDMACQSSQGGADSKGVTTTPSEKGSSETRTGTLPAAESAHTPGIASEASERSTNKEQDKLEPAHRKWTPSEKWDVYREGTHIGLEVLLVAIGVVALPIYYGQLVEMSKSTDAATKATQTAEQSLKLTRDFARLDQRPWVTPVAVAGEPKVDKPLSVSVQLKNTGKTPARKVEVNFGAQTVPDGRDPDLSGAEQLNPPDGRSKSSGVIAPNVDFILRITFKKGEKLTADEIRQIDSGKVRIFVFGKITYNDLFNAHHWTTFCYWLNPADGEYHAYHEYNDADNVK